MNMLHDVFRKYWIPSRNKEKNKHNFRFLLSSRYFPAKNPKSKAATPNNPCSSHFDFGFPTSTSFNALSVSSFSFSKAIL